MSANTRFDQASFHFSVMDLCNNAASYKENTSKASGNGVKKQELEKKVEALIDNIVSLGTNEIIPVLTKTYSDKSTDFAKLLVAIEAINPALASRVEKFQELHKTIEELKYKPGDTRSQIRRKIQKAEKLGLGFSTTRQNITELKINFLEPYLPKSSEAVAKLLNQSPELVDWMWGEITSLGSTEVKAKQEIVKFGFKHSGMIELLQRTEGTNCHSPEEILKKEAAFKRLHQDLPRERPEKLQLGKKGDGHYQQFVKDAERSLFSLDFQKIPLVGNSEDKARVLEKFEKNVKDPHLFSVMSVFHQGINASAIFTIMENIMNRGFDPPENIGQENGFNLYISIFKNEEGETVYRYINVLGACVQPENRSLPTKPFDEFYLHIVDCKAEDAGKQADIRRYLSPPLKSLDEAKQLMMAVLS